MTLRISVALCTHNGARFIEDQLHSILAQSRLPDELVISDDASTDDTVAKARAVMAGSPVRFVVIENPAPLGVTANFEQAVRATTGELIALSDQDDVWAPTKLELMAERLEATTLLLLFSDAALVNEQGASLNASLFNSLEISSKELDAVRAGDAFGTLLRRNLVTGATTVFRRSLLDYALPFDGRWLHDEWLAILAAAAGGIDWDADRLIDYRQHSSNQVGVKKPTLSYKVARVLESRGDRTKGLAARAQSLAERLRSAQLPGAELALAKAELEAARSALPASRIRRVFPILRAARGGAYRRFASRGRADIVRDLVQGA